MNNPNDVSELLSQSDIDALMREAMEEPREAVYMRDGRRVGEDEKAHGEAYDFELQERNT